MPHNQGEIVKIFGREPALWAGAFKAVLALATVFGLLEFSNEQTALVNAVAAGVLGALVAWRTNETGASALIALADAAIACAIGFSVELSPEQTAALITGVTLVLAMFNRTQVSPVQPGTATVIGPASPPAPALVTTDPAVAAPVGDVNGRHERDPEVGAADVTLILLVAIAIGVTLLLFGVQF